MEDPFMDTEEDALHNRFKSLIQPIKDLASNWDIDIADQLGDYLEELSRLTFTIDDDNSDGDEDEDDEDDEEEEEEERIALRPSRLSQRSNKAGKDQATKKGKKKHRKLNFAEAALLIQGSTHIYSKKVEYLYQLVLKSLEVITHRKSNILSYPDEEGGNDDTTAAEGGGRKGRSNKHDIDLLDFSSADPKYLLLDDYIEEGKNIDLPRPEQGRGLDRSRLGDNSRLSLDNSMHNISNISQISNASVSLMASFLQQDLGKSEFRLTSSFMNPDGTLAVPGIDPIGIPSTNNRRLSDRLSFMSAKKRQSVSFAADHEEKKNDMMDVVSPTAGAAAVPPPAEDYPEMAVDNYYPEDNNGHDDYGFSDRLSQDAMGHSTPVRPHAPPASHGPEAVAAVNKEAAPQVPAFVPPAVPNKAFLMHDPHEVLAGSKPIRKGRPYRLPKKSGLTDEEKFVQFMNETGASTSVAASSSSASGFLSVLNYSTSSSALFYSALVPLQKLKQSLDRKERLLQARLKKQQRGGAAGDADDDGQEIEQQQQEIYHNLYQQRGDIPAELEYMYQTNSNDNNDDNNNNNGGFEDMGGGDDYPAFDAPDMPAMPEDQEDAMLDVNEEEELTKRVEAALADPMNTTTMNAYETICKQYIEGFHTGANSYMRETQLMKRVSDWTKRIEPILNAQEEMRPFDIHEYSDEILFTANELVVEKRKSISAADLEDRENLNDENEKKAGEMEAVEQITFSELVAGKDSSEICRLFLSCLQLANAGNLEILSGNDQLLSTLAEKPMTQKNSKKQAGKKKGGKQQMIAEEELEMEQQIMLQKEQARKEMIMARAVPDNDILFRLSSGIRSKDIEEFRAPSVVHTNHRKA